MDMRRRELLRAGFAGAILPVLEKGRSAMAARLTPEEIKQRAIEAREKALANFPFERVDVAGQDALSTWEKLKAAGRAIPVVIGDDESFERLLGPFSPTWPNRKPLAAILSAAEGTRHPESLAAHRAEENARAHEFLRKHLESNPNAPLPKMIVTDSAGQHELTREETIAAMMAERMSPPIGDWPSQVETIPELSVALRRGKRPATDIHIVLVPTDDWTTVPAHLRWGGWNACPAPEYHIAALRSWRDRFGAELVGLASDTMNLRVTRRPQTRPEALDLAREQYLYCSDIVDQGVGTLSALAAALMENDWWYFWWD
jgi:hypothetical protein